MKAARIAILFLVCVLGGHASSIQVRAASARVDVAGKTYVRLSDWSRANGFELRWMKTENAFWPSKGSTRLIFLKDSRESVLGGINVCISYPIVVRDGAGYISQVDVDTAVGPLLYQSKNRKGAKIRNIVIYPGHGGKDPGNTVDFHQEK